MLEIIIYYLSQIIYSDKLFDKIRYFLKFYKILNLKDPITFNEKIIWKKHNEINPLSFEVSDKHLARNYVLSIDNSVLMPNIYAIVYSIDEIDFDILPEKFVVKATHGSGWNKIIIDKEKINKYQILKLCKKWLSMNYYYKGREKVYKNLIPKIIFEELLLDEDGKIPNDLKCFCFNGKVKFIQVDLDRFSNHARIIFDEKWNKLPVQLQYPMSVKNIPKPDCFDSVIVIAEKLSKNFDFIRVDLYILNNKIYFGELTNYPGCGLEKFKPSSYDRIFGDMLSIKYD